MKRNFDAVILDFYGKPLTKKVEITPAKEGDNAVIGYAPVTLGDVCVAAIAGDYRGEELSGNDRMLRFNLGMRLVNGGVVDVTAEEVTMLKTLIPKGHTTLATGRAFHLLESDPEQPAEMVE